MKWLLEFKKLIDLNFESNWVDLLAEGVDGNEFKKKLKNKELELLPKAYELLNFSVLEGEYINKPDEFLEILGEIHSKISNLQNPTISNDSEYIFSSILEGYQFFYSVKKALEFYKRISINIFTQIYNPEKTFVIDFSSLIFEGYDIYFSKKDNEMEEVLFKILYQNIHIARSGFFIENSDGQFYDLLNKIDELKKLKSKIDLINYSFQETIDVLNEICIFYQRKLIIRKLQDEEKFDHKYLYELVETNFDLEDHKLKKDFLKEWDKYSQNHYLSEKNQERNILLRRGAELRIKSGCETSSFLSVHSLIKYYKDVVPDTSKFKEFENYFENYQSTSKFNEFSKNVSLGYLKNNQISKKLEKIDVIKIKSRIQEINKYQEKCKINNYFPFYKICEFLKKEVEKKFKDLKNGKSDKFEDLKENINELKETFSIYRIKLKWSKNHLNYVYQLPFEECLTKVMIGKDEINVFVPSTFCLPINFEKFETFTDELNNFLLFCENELKSIENFFLLNKKISDKEQEISDVLKDQSKRNIELLGIFSAIIALLFQGAYTSQSNISFNAKFLTFVMMFIILASFLIMLRAFISTKKDKYEDLLLIRLTLFLIIPILLVVIYVLFKSV